MEPQTRYDLNAAIEKWRAELTAQPNLSAEVRRELETHLRDAIVGFQQLGLNDEESFWLACKRVGQPQQLREEFVKSDPALVWHERVFYVALVLFTFQMWNFACLFLLMVFLFGIHQHFPTWFEALNGPALGSLTYLLPILAFAVFLALGGTKHLVRCFQFIFPSRLTFVLVALTVVLFVHTHAFSYGIPRELWWIVMGRIDFMRTTMATGHWASEFLTNFLITECLALTLIALIAWLMPTQNPKTPKALKSGTR